MGWFDEQIRLRKKKDREAFSQTFRKIAGAVTGSRKLLADPDEGGNAQHQTNHEHKGCKDNSQKTLHHT